jgi:hypothetical protein
MSLAPKLTVRIEEWTPRRSNTLFGFVTVVIPEMRLRIVDLTVHESGDRRWVGLPGKPQIDKDGGTRHDDRGKVLYATVLQFTDRATRDAFSDRVIAALLEGWPNAFAAEEAAT